MFHLHRPPVSNHMKWISSNYCWSFFSSKFKLESLFFFFQLFLAIFWFKYLIYVYILYTYLVCVFIVVVSFVSLWTSDPHHLKKYTCVSLHLVDCFVPRHSIEIEIIRAHLCISPTHPLSHSLTHLHLHKLTLKTHTHTHAHCQSLEFVYNSHKNVARHASHLLFVLIFIHKKLLLHCVISSFIYFGVFFFCFQKSIDRPIHRCSIANSSRVSFLFLSISLFLSYSLSLLFSFSSACLYTSMSFFFTLLFLHHSFCVNFYFSLWKETKSSIKKKPIAKGNSLMKSARTIYLLECSIFLDVVINRFCK